MADVEKEEIGATMRQTEAYRENIAEGDDWQLFLGDAVNVLATLAVEIVDVSVYSPPFISLYTYTNSPRDLGNCSSQDEFLRHMEFVVRELLRVSKPGRITCCHCAEVTATKVSHGYIGLIDLPGALVRLYERAGWTFYGRITIQKNPQAQAIRTHAKALLFAQLRKDASWLRPALADTILVFRKPGENVVPVRPDISNEDWIEWAAPVWHGISESDTLSARAARRDDDDRHLAPLQLGVIERCIRLWSNRGELVLDPFAGIGSTGWEALRLGRRFIGVELKPEYWRAGTKNLQTMETQVKRQLSLPCSEESP